MDVPEDKPPGSKANMGISPGLFSANGALVRRFKSIWALWNGDWRISPAGTALHFRCYSIFMDIQRK